MNGNLENIGENPEDDKNNSIQHLEKKQCNVCGYFIPATANKCIHCESSQNKFLRVVNFWKVVFVLIAGLVTAVGISATPVVKTFNFYKDSDSFISIKFIKFDDNELQFFIDNRGGKPGIIYEGSLGFTAMGYEKLCDYRLDISEALIIEPKTTKKIKFKAKLAGCAPNDKNYTRDAIDGDLETIFWEIKYSNFSSIGNAKEIYKKTINIKNSVEVKNADVKSVLKF